MTDNEEEAVQAQLRARAVREWERMQREKAAAFDRAMESAEQSRAPDLYQAIVVEVPRGLGVQGSVYRIVKHVYTTCMEYLGEIDPYPSGRDPAREEAR